MIYTLLTKKAMKLCFDKHKDQFDKCGVPYPFHPFHVAESMDDEYSTCVALLHDIVEDTDVTFEDLESMEFPKEVIDAIRLMTHNSDEPYLEYVKRIKSNEIAKKVKISDLTHNSDITRLDVITERDIERNEKYKKALEILKG